MNPQAQQRDRTQSQHLNLPFLGQVVIVRDRERFPDFDCAAMTLQTDNEAGTIIVEVKPPQTSNYKVAGLHQIDPGRESSETGWYPAAF